MKKYVLSAVVTGLLVVPSAYAMDGGAAPAVEIEVPAVEVEVTTEDVAVDTGAVDDVKLDAVDAVVEVEVQIESVEVGDDSEIRFLGDPESVDGAVVDEVDPNAIDLGTDGGITFDDEGNPIQVCYISVMADGGECLEGPVVIEDGAVDPALFDLASQSGTPVDENGEPVVMYTFGASEGGELPLAAAGPVEGEAVDPNAEELAAQSGVVNDAEGNSNEVPLRSLDNIQPNFRGGVTDRGHEALAASSTGDESDAPHPQLLNDEQRVAVRGLRTEEESAKPRSGLGKLFSKFRKPKSEVTLASATTTDKAFSAKLAEIDRMRDTALRIGDQKALAKADKAEKTLRAQAGKSSKIPTRTK